MLYIQWQDGIRMQFFYKDSEFIYLQHVFILDSGRLKLPRNRHVIMIRDGNDKFHVSYPFYPISIETITLHLGFAQCLFI